jgi:hypothetical protein
MQAIAICLYCRLCMELFQYSEQYRIHVQHSLRFGFMSWNKNGLWSVKSTITARIDINKAWLTQASFTDRWRAVTDTLHLHIGSLHNKKYSYIN